MSSQSIHQPRRISVRPPRGFTLVEVAIVVTIIGLLIGGILKGQEMTRNAHATAVITQVQAYETAVATFRSTYDSYPGDMTTAAERLPGCNTHCNPFPTTGGNNIVGTGNWATTWESQVPGTVNVPPASELDETTLFWTHLLLASLIGGVDDTAIRGGQTAWGRTHPMSYLGGGYIIGYGNGLRPPGDPSPPPSESSPQKGPNGLLLVLAKMPDAGGIVDMTEPGLQPLLPSMAARIDKKMDDGFPSSGKIVAYGPTASCFSDTNGGIDYDGSISSVDCGLIFRITP